MTDFRDAFLIAWYACLLALICPAIMAAHAQVSMEISGNVTGQGSHEWSLANAAGLISQDERGSIQDWSFLLAFHGYNVPNVGILVLGGERYEIAENGSLEAM
ncbi:hypothetical protein M0R72_19695 [Candidatus Pacearchaeota archaeon]|jgi:hypothetical protein|nr:hypothetical protein [Candidatus Pacearchaeota archaeon]